MVVGFFVVFNVVLFLLFLVALALLRKSTPTVDLTTERPTVSEEDHPVVELEMAEAEVVESTEESVEAAVPADPLQPPLARKERSVSESVSAPTPSSSSNGHAPYGPEYVDAHAPHLFLIDRPAELRRPSYIRLVAGLDGDQEARDELICGVLQRLEPLGFAKKELTATHCRMVTDDGRTAAISTGRLGSGEERIELVIDHSLASDVLTELRRWHRVELNKSDRVQISALIR